MHFHTFFFPHLSLFIIIYYAPELYVCFFIFIFSPHLSLFIIIYYAPELYVFLFPIISLIESHSPVFYLNVIHLCLSPVLCFVLLVLTLFSHILIFLASHSRFISHTAPYFTHRTQHKIRLSFTVSLHSLTMAQGRKFGFYYNLLTMAQGRKFGFYYNLRAAVRDQKGRGERLLVMVR